MFEPLLKEIQEQIQNVPDFIQYLEYKENPAFESTQIVLQQFQISPKSCYEYLEKEQTLTYAVSPEIQLIEKIGIRLLSEKKLTLPELNVILKTLVTSDLTAKFFLQQLFRQKKITSHDFLFLNQGQWQAFPQQDIHYVLMERNGILEFSVSSNKPLQFGKYQILEEIGRGGMGIVYKAYHLHLKQIVALKVVLSGEHASEKLLQRFQREIQLLARLHHPGIVQIFDSGKDQEQYYFAMEYISGLPLKNYQGSLREKLLLFKKILEALAHAHQQNIIHRDLKLDNIFVTTTGEPKILDFGLSKNLANLSEEQRLTQSGTILGSPHYMPPEQASGEIDRLSPRSDVYSVGVCLYRILTKHFPFEASTFPQILSKILKDEVLPLSYYEKNIHPDLEAIVLKALEKDPLKRYTNAKDFSEDIDRFLNGYPVEARPLAFSERATKWVRRNKMVVAVSSIFFLGFWITIGLFYQATLQEQNKIFDVHYQEALDTLSLAEESRQQKDFFSVTQYNLRSLNALNRAIAIHPQSVSLEKLQQKIGQDLLVLAYQNQSFQLAELVLHLLLEIESVPPSLKKNWRETLEREKQKTKKKHLKRFDFLLADLKTRDWDDPFTKIEATDALYEISKMSEPEMMGTLEKLLQESHQYFTNTTPASLHTLHPSFYLWIAELVRRQKNTLMIPSLLDKIKQFQRSLESIQKSSHTLKIQYLIILFKALGDLAVKESLPLLEEFRAILEDKANFDRRTQQTYLKLLAIVEVAFPAVETEEHYRKRGVQQIEKKEYWKAIQNFTKAIRINPSLPEQYNLRGLAYYKFEKYPEAIRDFTQALALRPDYLDALNNRALVRSDLQDYQGALEDFNQSILLAPEDSSLYSNRGNVYLLQKNISQAIEDFTTAIRYDPSNLKAFYNRGNLEHAQENYTKALADFNRVLKLDPEFADAYNSRGNTKKRLEDWAGALSDYNQAIFLDPKNPTPYANRGELKQWKEDIEGALADYSEAIRLDSEFIEAYEFRATLYREIEAFEEALLDFNRLLQLRPQEGVYHYYQGLVNAQRDDFEKAVSDFNNALQFNFKDPEIFFARGVALKNLNQFSLSLADFNQFLETSSELPLAYIYRGEVKKMLKDINGALADFNQFIEIEPESTQGFLARGKLYYSQKAWKRALADFSQILELDSEDSEAYFYRGKTKRQLREFAGAIDDFDQALQKNPKYTQVYYELGYALYSYNKITLAKKNFSIFLKRTKNAKSQYVLRQREQIFKWYPELETK